jgi:hypothetical protein
LLLLLLLLLRDNMAVVTAGRAGVRACMRVCVVVRESASRRLEFVLCPPVMVTVLSSMLLLVTVVFVSRPSWPGTAIQPFSRGAYSFNAALAGPSFEEIRRRARPRVLSLTIPGSPCVHAVITRA